MNLFLSNLRATWVGSGAISPEDFLLLALHVLNLERTEFFKERDFKLTPGQFHTLELLLERRKQKEPIAYLVGQREFFGRNFLVNEHTLIPRPETECLVEDVLSFRKNTQTPMPDYVVDIGTGSGAIITTLASELSKTGTQFIASDISHDALPMAKKNATAHVGGERITFLHGSLLQPYKKIFLQNQKHSVFIVANLPYVSQRLLDESEPDVKNYEPHTALVSEEDGIAHYRKLFDEIKKCELLTGWCWIEISPEQANLLQKMIQDHFLSTDIFIGKDLSQRNRFIRFSF